MYARVIDMVEGKAYDEMELKVEGWIYNMVYTEE